MKLYELIAILSKEDPEIEVVTENYECGGYSFLSEIRIINKLVLDYNSKNGYQSPHEDYAELKMQGKLAVIKQRKLKVVKAVAL